MSLSGNPLVATDHLDRQTDSGSGTERALGEAVQAGQEGVRALRAKD
jgi:hypothetical protein